jgi:excinuclease UvrABC ATPase subunit
MRWHTLCNLLVLDYITNIFKFLVHFYSSNSLSSAKQTYYFNNTTGICPQCYGVAREVNVDLLLSISLTSVTSDVGDCQIRGPENRYVFLHQQGMTNILLKIAEELTSNVLRVEICMPLESSTHKTW